MRYLVCLANGTGMGGHGRHELATIVVDLPEDYSFEEDIDMNSRTAGFKKLLEICHEQCPSGFHAAHWMTKKEYIGVTKVIAISPLG